MLTAGKLFVKTFCIFDTRKDDNLTNVQLIAMMQTCEDLMDFPSDWVISISKL